VDQSLNEKEEQIMPRTKEVNARIRQERRAHILEAAWRVFARKGTAATMEEIAVEASVSNGLVYRYFSTKEALFAELVERTTQSSLNRVQQALDLPGTPLERLTFLLSGALTWLREHPGYALLTHHVISDETAPDALREQVRQQGDLTQEAMRRLIVEGQTLGQIAEGDPDQLLFTLESCLIGLALSATSKTPEQFQRQFPDIEMLLRLLKP
jgi:AcrR family transcriptional regulator